MANCEICGALYEAASSANPSTSHNSLRCTEQLRADRDAARDKIAAMLSAYRCISCANVSGALVDAGGAVPDETTAYGAAVRGIVAELDRVRAEALAMREALNRIDDGNTGEGLHKIIRLALSGEAATAYAARVKALEAVAPYAQHAAGCEAITLTVTQTGKPCSCGCDSALAALDATKETR